VPTKITEKQTKLAKRAQDNPDYRFKGLYQLLHWQVWIEEAAQRVLSRPGSSTAGIDGKTRDQFKRKYDQEIERIVGQLKTGTYEPLPVRRVYIPKGNGKKRPLGIPVLRDRIVQEALRMILDPIYETDFQHHSYGFRKGRRTMDAIAVLMPLFNSSIKHYYVIEGDIKSYFDAVHHKKLMTILRRRIADKAILALIWKFLKTGVMEGQLFAQTESGVPQGGIVSPLLANVYLNEFDKWAENRWHQRTPTERQAIRRQGKGNFTMVRYADDFVIVSNGPIAEVRAVKEEVKAYLQDELALELSEEKTKITHVNDGFDFLGFNIQRVKPEGKWVVHLRPTQKSRERVKQKIKALTTRGWTWMDEYTRLTTLNAIVRGWSEYYKHTSLHRDLEEISRYTWFRYFNWLRKKHQGSRKKQLIREKTVTFLGRTRWKAEIRQGDDIKIAYQWLPSPKELPRSRYRMKGRGGFPHPYLTHDRAIMDNPEWEGGPSERIYQDTIGVASLKRGEPLQFAELKLRVKIRDQWQCTRCGNTQNLRVHHRKGTKSHAMKDLETLCLDCHKAEHNYRTAKELDGEPDASKEARPVREEEWEKSHLATDV